MANKKPKQNKPKTGLARCLELASNKKGLVFLSAMTFSLAAIASVCSVYCGNIFHY